MSHSPTPTELLALRTANAALLKSPDASYDIVATVVFALGSAQLLQPPETATEVELQSRELSAALAENERLRAELAKYVGHEPTIAEEMAYLRRCLDAVHDLCNAAEMQATRWEQPLPVPEWVALVRNAADGVTDAAPALPPAAVPRQQEDPHTSLLHHDYAEPRDLPAPTDLPESLR